MTQGFSLERPPSLGEKRALAPGVVLLSATTHHRERTRRVQPSLRRYLAALAFLLTIAPLHAQTRDSSLSEAEIEQVRDQRYYPADCLLLYAKFLDLRTQEIHDLYAKPRRPGREQDTHDLLEQFTSIADELSDNLDDYGPRHVDIRKALPKILDATERWSSAIKSPPDDETYNVARKVALEAIRDLRESATELAASQVIWFKAHPPTKQHSTDTAPPIDIPR